MNKITQYVAKTILLSIFVVLIVLIGLYVIFSFVGESGDIGQGSYNTLSAMEYVFLSIPNNLSFILPAASLLGTLIGLGQLASHSELIAIRAAGVSVFKVAISVALCSVVMMVLSFMLSSYIGPVAARQAMVTQISAKNNRAFLLTPQSTWLKDGDDFVFVGKSATPSDLSNVTKYNFEKGQLVSVTHADNALYKNGLWHVSGVSQANVSIKGVVEQKSPHTVWKNLVSPQLLKVVSSQVNNLNIVRLYEYIQYREKNHLSVDKLQLKFWQIIFQPVAVLILMLMAIPFVYGPLRSSTMGVRLVFGVVFGFVFFVLDRFFGPFSLVLDWPPILGAIIPSLVFFVIMCVSLLRMN